MIATITIGKSFAHCIGYCLEDKRALTDEKKKELTGQDGLHHKNRAEVLAYNQCYGNKKELAAQFMDVRKLSRRVEKPVLHASLRLAPGEVLSRGQWLSIAEEMAKELGVAKNQYIVIQHHDTKEQHIHLVANRVSFDGKAASTGNNFYKMDKLCRRLEKEYHLTQVLSPKQFLPKDQQQLPRHDKRKEKMRQDLVHCLKQATSLNSFFGNMQQLGYTVIKGRGISFIDDKKVKVKGSELGFSLSKIETYLQTKQARNLKGAGLTDLQKNHTAQERRQGARFNRMPEHLVPGVANTAESDINKVVTQVTEAVGGIVSELFSPSYPSPEDIANAEAMREFYRHQNKKKKKRGYRP